MQRKRKHFVHQEDTKVLIQHWFEELIHLGAYYEHD